LRRAHGDASLSRRAGKRNLLLKVGPQDRKPRHGVLALLLGQASESGRGCGLAHRFVLSRGAGWSKFCP